MDLDEAYTEFLTNQVAPPPAPPMPEPVATPEPKPGEFYKGMPLMDALGIVARTAADLPDAAVRGAAEGLGELIYAANIIDENQINSYRSFFKDMDKLRDVSGVNPTVSSIGEDVGQILPAAVPAFKALKAIPFITRPVAAILAEGIGGAVGYNPDDPNLGNVISGMIGDDKQGVFSQAMRMLATNPEDPDKINRARNFAQDAGIGGMFEGVFKAIQKSPDAGRAALQWFNDTVEGAQQGTMFSGIPTRPDAPAGAPTVAQEPVVRPEEQSRMVSARYPTAVKRDEDPVATQLNIGYEAVAADKKLLQRNTDILRIYPGLRPNHSANAEEFAGEFIDDVKQNLIYLHNKVPEQTRQRSKLWYEGANKIANDFSTKYEVPDTSVAGVMAALSPQKDWFMNVSLAGRTLDVLTNQRSFVFSDEMAGRMEQIFSGPKYAALREMMTGKTLDDLTDPAEKAFFVRIHDETYADRSHRIITPEGNFSDVVLTDKGEPSGTGWGSLVEISKAVRAYESGGDRSLMTEILGSKHKVRSFYNNIIEPNSANGDVTIDTHAVAAALLRPLSGQSREVHHNFGSSPMKVKQPENWQGAANSSKTGVQGTYGLYAEAYRQAAADLGILPRELQSITWEAVRGLFTDRFKSGKNNVSDINAIWSRYSSGELSIDEVRNAVEQRAGGIDAPSWQ